MRDLGGYSKKGHQWSGNSIKDQELWEEIMNYFVIFLMIIFTIIYLLTLFIFMRLIIQNQKKQHNRFIISYNWK